MRAKVAGKRRRLRGRARGSQARRSGPRSPPRIPKCVDEHFACERRRQGRRAERAVDALKAPLHRPRDRRRSWRRRARDRPDRSSPCPARDSRERRRSRRDRDRQQGFADRGFADIDAQDQHRDENATPGRVRVRRGFRGSQDKRRPPSAEYCGRRRERKKRSRPCRRAPDPIAAGISGARSQTRGPAFTLT